MDAFAMHILIASLLLWTASPAWSHVALAPALTDDLAPWTFEPWVVICLLLSLGLYLAGAAQLLRRVQQGRSRLVRQAVAFACGWCALAAALVSPIDAMGTKLFSAHMVQHELLMIVAAPLMVLGRPFGVWLWALPLVWRQRIGSTTRWQAVEVAWQAITFPVGAWLMHAAALWLWHVPSFFQAGLVNETIHTFQHMSFLVTALLFWWAVLGESFNGPPRGASILYLFTTMMHTGALGALLTVSDNLWYPAYARTTEAFDLTPLEDQQLGGLIMWVPGGLVYVIVGLLLCLRWLTQAHATVGVRPLARNAER
jgi:putative membrane protein